MANKTYMVGPDDGWVKVLTSATKNTARVQSYPENHPYEVYTSPSATPPTSTTTGMLMESCCFEVQNMTVQGNVENFYVRTKTAGPTEGRTRIDVYTDLGTLA